MNAIEFLNEKGITRLTCYTNGNETYYFHDLVKIMEEYADSKVKNLNEETETKPLTECICETKEWCTCENSRFT
jgi:hypothetical protein